MGFHTWDSWVSGLENHHVTLGVRQEKGQPVSPPRHLALSYSGGNRESCEHLDLTAWLLPREHIFSAVTSHVCLGKPADASRHRPGWEAGLHIWIVGSLYWSL